MIKSIVSGSETSKIVIVEDTQDVCGRGILVSFSVALSKRFDEVHIFVFDVRGQDTVQAVQELSLQNVQIHNAGRDLVGWEQTAGLNIGTNLQKYLLGKIDPQSNRKIGIVIDSLSPMLTHKTAPYTCQTIHGLAHMKELDNQVQQIVCLVHRDLHEDTHLSLVHHTASTVHTLDLSSNYMFCCNTLHKRVSGKVVRVKENFNISDEFSLTDVEEVKVSSLPKFADDQAQVDPAANLTFNLTLSDKEKEARSQLILPYTQSQQRQESTLINSAGEGKIFYQPDEADDFDEEDPDDDLDV